MSKKYIGKVVSLQFADWKQPISGVVLYYNDQFTLMRNLDGFRLDGYIIISHRKGMTYNCGEWEKMANKILKLKGYTSDDIKIPEVELTDLESILIQLSKRCGAFGLHRKWENELYVGKFLSSDAKNIYYDFLIPNGRWDGETVVKKGEIRTVEFDTEYVNSLLLYSNSKKRKRTTS